MEQNILEQDKFADTWVQTNSGIRFNFLNVAEDMISIEDIAHALSLMCRYNGHCKKFFSVAEHSYLLSQYVLNETGNKKKAREALLHDAAEYIIADLPRPVKYSLPQYRILEKNIERVIAKVFNLDYPMGAWLKELDARMLKTERFQVMTVTNMPWEVDSLEVLDLNVMFYPSDVIKELFLDQFIRTS